ncbi:unnamed protein product [Ostreobium quekettii]|uniref:Uncharacterized protein n=1 Tax=Ostreobium quekettii TaxID=121088 RepID=A0A8S1JBQ8_9CHLO|nr:unnamed protein product [Ostreobium quekettii]
MPKKSCGCGCGAMASATRPRTADALGVADNFAKILLPPEFVRALSEAGFKKPSPVQEVALPLSRLGSDLVVQAKSGTGKTLVFAVACLERVDPAAGHPQALVLTPTREVAVQVASEIERVASGLPPPYISVGVFIGGVSVAEDRRRLRRRCQVVVGTPGRMQWLLESRELRGETLSTCVLDEADQLFSGSLKEAVERIVTSLPKAKQLMAFSATYTQDVQTLIEGHMRHPQRVLTVPRSKSAALLGVRHCYSLVEDAGDGEFSAKVAALLAVLSSVSFHQTVVFCNRQSDAQALADRLTRAGFPAAFISGQKPQEERLETMSAMRGFELRVIVSTDLVARGVDLERVNLVCCLDVPQDPATYMHRIGRTGRFGTYGLCIAFVNQNELLKLQACMRESAGREAEPLPDPVPEDWYAYQLGSPEEEVAYERLLQAPVVPEPLRHFQDEPEHWVDDTGGAVLDWWRDWMGRREGIWDAWDPYECDGHGAQAADDFDAESVVYSEECLPSGDLWQSEDSDPLSDHEANTPAHGDGSEPADNSAESERPSALQLHVPTECALTDIFVPDSKQATVLCAAEGSLDSAGKRIIGEETGAEPVAERGAGGHHPRDCGFSSAPRNWAPSTQLPLPMPSNASLADSVNPLAAYSHWLQQYSFWDASQRLAYANWQAEYMEWHARYSQWYDEMQRALSIHNAQVGGNINPQVK